MNEELKPRITSIRVGRLHSLGNYEHERYEVSVEVPPGTRPGELLAHIRELLDAIDPQPPVSEWDAGEAERTLRAIADGAAAEWERKNADHYVETLAKQNRWRTRREGALRELDTYGVSRTFVPAPQREEEL